MKHNNKIKVYTTSSGAELSISAPSVKQVISATNNRAQFYAEQALKYRDEARGYRDSAKYYADQNSDVTFEYIDGIRSVLEEKISQKQEQGNYALKDEIPVNVSELNNDLEYVENSKLSEIVEEIRLPSCQDCENQYLYTDGADVFWSKLNISGLELCDIGMALFVDESKGLRRYLNGQIVDINTNTQAFLNRLLQIQTTNPDYFTDEETWQAEATLNIDGCVYKFVLNYADDGETVVSVRLPKYPDYVEINAGGTLPVYGNGITLGLTNGTQNVSLTPLASSYYTCACMDDYGKRVGSAHTGGYTYTQNPLGVTTNPSKSGIVANLDQTKLKMRYFIQIATGSETENNIINDIELNNPYSLFDSKYSDHELNNLSWLKSEGQWNAKLVYSTAYDKLLKVYNGTEIVEGLSVKLSTVDYTDYDFVLNTSDETFRLPLKNHTADDEFTALILYYYVGETVQNANLIDAGRIEEQLAGKADISTPSIQAPYLKTTYVNGTSGYNIWSNGYCEQWGSDVISNAYSSSEKTVSFLKTFKDVNYTVQVSMMSTTTGFNTNYITIKSKSTNNFKLVNTVPLSWQASGYIW